MSADGDLTSTFIVPFCQLTGALRAMERTKARGVFGFSLSLFEVLSLAAWLAIWGIYLAGWLAPLDNALRDQRFRVGREITQDVVFVDIDARTLAAVGVWPWPRNVYADLIDRLIEDEALDILIDVDFSAASTEAGDAALEAALERAGGFVMLAAFQNGDEVNLPRPRFLRHAMAVTVNVGVDALGVVRTYPSGLTLEGKPVPSAATALAGVDWTPNAAFAIDFSIPPEAIERVSAADVLSGKVLPGQFYNRQVVIGASALELRDIFATPVSPIVPGALVQIIAAETLKQGRSLTPLGPWPVGIGITLIALFALTLRLPIPLVSTLAVALGVAIILEAMALALQASLALLLDTAALQLATGFFLLRAMGLEIGVERLLRVAMSRERDAMRKILDRVIADNFDGVLVVDADGSVLAVSRLAAQALGRPVAIGDDARKVLPWVLSEAVSAQFAGVVPQPRPLALQVEVAGNLRTIEYTVTRSDVPGRSTAEDRRVVCLTFRDVTERDSAAEQLRYLADHDPMSGALSRHRLLRMVEEALAQHKPMALIIVGLGRLKSVNATLGHIHGDAVLRQVVGRLSAHDFHVARIGGTTYAIARQATLSPGALMELCRDLTIVLSEPYELPDRQRAVVTACVGGTTSTLSPGGAEVMLRHADMALAAARGLAGNHAAIFAPTMEASVQDAQTLQLALRDAIASAQFRLVYQPQFNLVSGRPVGAEVLLRWQHPMLGDISPAKFIPVAEETGLILEIGRWVLGAACREAARWPRPTCLAVNVSPIQFVLGDVLTDVVSALSEARLPADRLEIEITEGVFVQGSADVTETLDALRKLGVRIALDDFGTGYSSLSYLTRLPVDKLKIDQSFVRRLPGDSSALAVVDAIITMGTSLGKRIVAEGIETEDQAALLKRMGCDDGQGFLYSRPIPGSDLARILESPFTLGRMS